MKPLFCRIGSKHLMSEDIISNFPEHLIYVEPFIGGGGVYWNKEPSSAEVINDLDTTLINDYRLIKKVSPDTSEYPINLNTIDKLTKFIKQKNSSNEDKLIEAVIRRCNGFSGRYTTNNNLYNPTNPYIRLKNIKEYKDRIKKTVIKNEDYKKIILKYDTSDTLFYLDPPYENSADMYFKGGHVIDYEEMASILKNIKGKFVLSINGSPYIKRIFGNFKIKKIKLKTRAHKSSVIGLKPREELLIMN
jgi:DNA adenine methylase